MTPSEPMRQNNLDTARHVQSRARAALFSGLRSEDPKQREVILDQICRFVKSETQEHYGSRARSVPSASSRATTPPDSKRGSLVAVSQPDATPDDGSGLPHDPSADGLTGNQQGQSSVIDEVARQLSHFRASPSDEDDGDEESLEERKELLRRDVLAILRLSIDCPFSDVRRAFTQLLSKLRSLHAPTPMPIYPSPSYFISPYDTITLEWPLHDSDDYQAATSRRSPAPPSPPSRTSSTKSEDPSSGSSSLSSSPPSTFDEADENSRRCHKGIRQDNAHHKQDSGDGLQQDSGAESSSSCPSSNNPPNTPATPISPLSMPIGRQPDKHTRQLMVRAFLHAGRLSHVNRILAFFPQFWERYQDTYERVIKSSEGPVPKPWRCYIGIMAAAQNNCQYLVSLLSTDFLLCNGDEKWLQGLEHAPAKLRNLAALNTILAHQPWRLTAAHIAALTKPSANPAENWNTPEIVQVIIILSTFHSLSSFVLGCGIVPEYDTMGGNVRVEEPPLDETDIARGLGVTMQTESGPNDNQMSNGANGDEPVETAAASSPTRLLIRTASTAHALVTAAQGDAQQRQETEQHTSQLITRLKESKEREMQASAEEAEFSTEHQHSGHDTEQVVSVFANCEEETFTNESPTATTPPPLVTFSSTNGVSTTSAAENLPVFPPQLPPANAAVEDISRFRDLTVEIPHEEFDVRSTDYSVFRLQEYCWEDHAVPMINEYLPGVGEVLDNEFREVQEITDRSSIFHSQGGLDTTPLRQAIWFYALRLSGLLKDDYNYHNINMFLNRRIKRFIKKVCCEPDKIEFNDWNNVGFQLRAEEKCHVNLIASEAKKQAELVYGLWCVMRRDDRKSSQTA